MAAVGPTRQSRVSMSVSMSLVQGGAAASAAGTVLGMLHIRHYYLNINLNGAFITINSCCRSILSGAQHPARCSTGSSDRLWSFRCRLVSFTFQFAFSTKSRWTTSFICAYKLISIELNASIEDWKLKINLHWTEKVWLFNLKFFQKRRFFSKKKQFYLFLKTISILFFCEKFRFLMRNIIFPTVLSPSRSQFSFQFSMRIDINTH